MIYQSIIKTKNTTDSVSHMLNDSIAVNTAIMVTKDENTEGKLWASICLKVSASLV